MAEKTVEPDPFQVVNRAERRLRWLYSQIRDEVRVRTGVELTGEQAFIVGAMRDNQSVMSLMKDGAYCGSNVSYNVRILADVLKLVQRVKGARDKRSVLLKRTDKGLKVAEVVRKRLPELLKDEQYANA
jgi:DNA-binding MarR family transcriptional regulator